MSNQEYAEKLKDVRWQKKRLKILERDNWTCQWCEATDRTLECHHEYCDGALSFYSKGRDPWDYPDDTLITYCDICHEYRHALKNLAKEMVQLAIQ